MKCPVCGRFMKKDETCYEDDYDFEKEEYFPIHKIQVWVCDHCERVEYQKIVL